jgi:hypothetical protein
MENLQASYPDLIVVDEEHDELQGSTTDFMSHSLLTLHDASLFHFRLKILTGQCYKPGWCQQLPVCFG